MSWQTIDLTTINPNLEIVPEGPYTFSISGAKYGTTDPGRVEVTASIVTEGDYTGRKLFFSYPDPEKKDWAPKAFKRLEQALGVDAMVGEGPVEYLNRVAGNRFRANVAHSKPTEEYPNPKANLNIFTVAPAA